MIVGFWQSQPFKMALEVGRFVPLLVVHNARQENEFMTIFEGTRLTLREARRSSMTA